MNFSSPAATRRRRSARMSPCHDGGSGAAEAVIAAHRYSIVLTRSSGVILSIASITAGIAVFSLSSARGHIAPSNAYFTLFPASLSSGTHLLAFAGAHLYNSPPHPLMIGNNLSETTSLCGGQPPADSRTPRRNTPVAKRSGWVSAKRELRSCRKAPCTARRRNCFCKLFQLF